MNYPLISVIIPIYKVEAYLSRCLDSILQQSYSNLELLCVNDGSPDGCLDILKDYAQKDPRVKVIDQKNQGVSVARNNGLREASGDYIAYIDSDDWIHGQYFELMMKYMLEYNADVVFCKGMKVYDDEEPDAVTYQGVQAQKVNLQNVFSLWAPRHCVWARIYCRRLLDGHYFASEIRLGEDTMFNLDVLCHADSPIMYYLNIPLYYWFMRRDSITHTHNLGGVLGEAEWYVKHMDKKEVTGAEWIIMEQAIKACLSTRYSEMFTEEAEEYKDKANRLMREFIPKFWKSSYAPLKKKFLLSIMYCFPFLYRRFRLLEDPTLHEWERNEKIRQTENRLEKK